MFTPYLPMTLFNIILVSLTFMDTVPYIKDIQQRVILWSVLSTNYKVSESAVTRMRYRNSVISLIALHKIPRNSSRSAVSTIDQKNKEVSHAAKSTSQKTVHRIWYRSVLKMWHTSDIWERL
jgi:hypothetical protein